MIVHGEVKAGAECIRFVLGKLCPFRYRRGKRLVLWHSARNAVGPEHDTAESEYGASVGRLVLGGVAFFGPHVVPQCVESSNAQAHLRANISVASEASYRRSPVRCSAS